MLLCCVVMLCYVCYVVLHVDMLVIFTLLSAIRNDSHTTLTSRDPNLMKVCEVNSQIMLKICDHQKVGGSRPDLRIVSP